MAITASDVLYAKQAPEKLAKELGHAITVEDAFYLEQAPERLATKLGISKDTAFYAESGSSEFAEKANKVLTSEVGA